jgi:hypothetical protein
MTDNPSHRPRSESELVETIRAIDERAPDRLHARVQAMAAEQGRTHTTLRGALGGMRLRLGALAATGAALGAALALALGGAGSAGLSLGEAAALTLQPATRPAPSENHHARAELTASVDGIPFPYWEDHFGWRSSGSREDTVDGHHVRTVFYTDGKGRRVGYAIVAGHPAPHLGSGTVHWHEGTPYHLAYVGGKPVVTWYRDGHLCVVSGNGMDGKTLLTLAGWDENGD